jgi:hypothetical protein
MSCISSARPARAYRCNDKSLRQFVRARRALTFLRRRAREAHGGVPRWQRQLFRAPPRDMLISWWRRTLGLSWHGCRSFFAVRLKPEAWFAEGITASGQGQRLTKSDSDKGAAIIPIDAQPLGMDGFGRAAGRYDREDFRPSSIGRTRSGLWEPPRP